MKNWIGTGVFAALLVVSTAAANAEEHAPLYTKPPSPQVLAAHLFGPSQRTGYFGMRIQFAFDSDALRAESLPLLDSVGRMMSLPESAGRSVMVEGHTDGVGSATYNDGLSLRRAEAVVSYLTESFDLPRERFAVSGRGERELLEPENPGADVNRRAVFRAVQKLRLK